MVNKYFQQAVSKNNKLEYSEWFIIQAILQLLDKKVAIHLLVDNGSSEPILYEDYVRKQGLLVKKRHIPN